MGAPKAEPQPTCVDDIATQSRAEVQHESIARPGQVVEPGVEQRRSGVRADEKLFQVVGEYPLLAKALRGEEDRALLLDEPSMNRGHLLLVDEPRLRAGLLYGLLSLRRTGQAGDREGEKG